MLNSKFTTLLLIGLCTIMGNLIYYLINNPQDIPDINSVAQTAEVRLEKTPVSQVNSLANISEFEEITQRPLFSSDRQPAKEVAEQETIQAPARNPDLKLTGIVLSDEGQVALIKSRKDPKLKRIKLEESINGWKLIEIKSNSVKLESRNQQITLEMTRKADPDPAQAQKNKTKSQQLRQEQQTRPSGIDNNIKQSKSALRNFDGINTIPAIPDNQPKAPHEDEDEDD